MKLTFSFVGGSNCRSERSKHGFVLFNATYSSKITQGYRDCVDLCLDDARCTSFNFWWTTRICDLNNATKESCQACFVPEPSSTFMGMGRQGKYPLYI